MTEFNWTTLQPLFPELFLAAVALISLLIGALSGEVGTKLVNLIAFSAFVWTAIFVIISGYSVYANGDEQIVLNGFFIRDWFGDVMKILVLTGMVAVSLLSFRYMKTEGMNRFEYPVLLMFVTLGMLAMISANNLLALYVGLELQSLAIYVLAAFQRDRGRSSEAGLKYFILGALSSGMLLFGISYIYGYTGALGYEAIADALKGAAAGPGLITGLVFVIVGIAFKISAAPFHMWTPDVYEGAPTSVTALMAIAPKAAAMAMLVRLLCGPFLHIFPQWQQIVWFLSVASMAWGSFAAIGQKNIKRLLAYSSISNMGYALIGLVAGTADGVSSVIVYMAIYMAMTAGAFAIVLSMRRGGVMIEEIEGLAGLSRTHPLRAYGMAFLMFSMAGVPPLAGFFGKLVVFQAAIAAGLPVLAVIGVVLSVVAAYYYLRVIKIMFFDENTARLDHSAGFGVQAVMTASVLFVLFFIVMPGSLIAVAQSAALDFFRG